MRILILGGAGMLGHQLWRRLHHDHEVWVTLRKPLSHYSSFGLFEPDRTLSGVDVTNAEALNGALRTARPEAVVNCVGIIKQLKEATIPLLSLTVNSMLPHQLAQACSAAGARLIHISTDCVFSGRKGNYTEEDLSDAEDLYGRTKFLGEVHEPHCITLRTSIIGRELETRSGLIEWFLSQRGKKIKGFRRAIYTGFTTYELARVIEGLLVKHPGVGGLWQVSSDPINKYDLLELAKSAFEWEGEIVPDDTFVCDRSLNSSKFRQKTGYQPPSWNAMIRELANKTKTP
ncbi:MAG TPA: SDR family oxidoreductase [Candidatus Saccharimonadales bacterium]|nr:SDR family oxidoreductase [Candidatus Saccharimonadales bacterium]